MAYTIAYHATDQEFLIYIYIRIFARISGGSGVEDGSVDGSEKFKSQVSS